MSGAVDRLGGHFLGFRGRAVCAIYGAPRQVRRLPDGAQVWYYNSGTAIVNLSAANRRLRFRHPSGRIIFKGQVVAMIEFGTGTVPKASRKAIGG